MAALVPSDEVRGAASAVTLTSVSGASWASRAESVLANYRHTA